MFYRICNDKHIFAVTKSPTYVRYIKKIDRCVTTDRSSAHGISYNGQIYYLQGIKLPEGVDTSRIVRLEPINETTYNELKELLKTNTVMLSNYSLQQLREQVITNLSNECKNKIIDGIDIVLSDGMSHHFKLTIEDQINLLDIKQQLDNGRTQVLYHATNSLCKIYSAKDMYNIIKRVDKHKEYHTTYFNILKHCINSMYNEDEIRNIYYGIDLSTLDISNDLTNLVRSLNNDE